jgi:hypothetical protein
MKKTAFSISFLILGLLIIPRPAFSYIGAVHFYTTLLLGAWCGLDDHPFEKRSQASVAVALAWANITTDNARETSPGAKPSEWLDLRKMEDRKVFHFRSLGLDEKTKRASAIATRPALLSIENTKTDDPKTLEFGIAIHAFQDSYAHEDYAPRFGHWNTTAVDYPHNEPQKAMEMAEGTYTLLNLYFEKRFGMGCKQSFKEIMGLYEVFVRLRASSQNEVTSLWQKNAESVLGRNVSMSIFDQDQQLLAEFLKSSRWIRADGALENPSNIDPITPIELERFFEDRSGPHIH